MTIPIAALLAIAAGGGLFIQDLYRDAPSFVAQAVAQDFVTLVVGLPALIISVILAKRSSKRAYLVWLGVLVYLIYTYVVAAFSVRFNSMFVVYVALLGCSLYSLIGGIATADLKGIEAGFTEKTPTRAPSNFLVILAVLFYFLWLSEIVPALLTGEMPQAVKDVETPTNAIHVLDMAWILPAMGLTAVWLRRKQGIGYASAGALLIYVSLMVLAIMSMVVFMTRDGHPVVIGQIVIFGVLLIINWV
jgi:hypothetical protein